MKATVDRVVIARAQAGTARVSGVRVSDAGKAKTSFFHPSLVDYWNFKAKSNSDPDRDTIKGVKGNILNTYNFSWSLGSGYGLYKENYRTYMKNIFVVDDHFITILNFVPAKTWVVYKYGNSVLNATKIKVTGLTADNQLAYGYFSSLEGPRKMMPIPEDGIYDLPESFLNDQDFNIGFFLQNALTKDVTIEQIPEYEGAIVTDGVDDYLRLDKVGYHVGTIIIKYVPLNLNGTWQYIFDAETQRVFAAHQTGVITTGFNNKETIDNYLVLRYNADNIKTITTSFDISKSFRNNEFLSMALYDIALYEDSLTDTEIEKEITKIQSL